MVFTDTGGTDFEWKNRWKADDGSGKASEMFQAFRGSLSGVWKPARQRESSEFHSTGCICTSRPTSFRFFWTSSFMASGSIWPEPEVEIKCTALGGRWLSL